MRKITLSFFFLFSLVFAPARSSQAQTQGNQQQPLNASVSDFGTSFIFSPAPICSGCVETEFGFTALQEGRFLPAVVSVSPIKTSTDITLLVNAVDSEMSMHKRITHFGDRFDLVVRQKIFEKNGLVLTVAPRGTIFTRDIDGGHLGASLAAQYGKGNNLGIVNFTFTKAVGASPFNPKSDYQGSFDYYRTLTGKGIAVFAGVQHEAATANSQLLSIEQGLVLPFRNGQVEFAVEQLNLNVQPVWQFQARAIVNWGKVFKKR